ncbi:MAG: (p)ppGpp synthetase [Parcubacteria group bacterium CG11_big_fil_rev_8_21_14_0_20_39_14]|nr:MAG: (p)ppGpp synthetase [Parcubacteria group bacterium CG11_big_fil_rev_8_21_14_0_20_39_14]PIS35486.1 MAG: (p)ppGpp synthetase [Parcubacteria group bacterium CG08_land_8_20_14_0_20_38_56]
MEDFLKTIKSKYNPEDQKLIERALEFAKLTHNDQKRLGSSQPYIVHPIAVAKNLVKLNFDSPTIAAALLHDSIEDANIPEKTIEKGFGKEVAFLVQGVTKLGKIKYQGMERYVENLRKMFLAMAEDIRVVLIKLFDRLNNLETLDALPERKQKRIAEETLDIYGPLSHRLGIGELKGQLEDLAFPYARPKEYNWLMENIKERREQGEKYLKKVRPIVLKELKKEKIAPLDIHTRAKHYFSLYQKLLRQDMDFDKIYDLVALRIITNSEDIEKCYEVLGVIHKLWKPLPGLIKDYIALPKPNGYRSLHTTVLCLDGKITEFQIRTPMMHKEAEYGIAAHWAYVEMQKPKNGVKIDKKKFGWVKEIRNWQKENRNSEEFLENLKINFFKNRVFVLTPKGDVIDLPEGSCPVDFAYQIHTDLGHKCQAAKINGKIVALNKVLQNWDVVEIIPGKEVNPKRNWLYFVKTGNARSRIKNWLKNQNKTESFKQGTEILNQSLSQFKNITLDKLSRDKKEGLLKKFSRKTIEELIISVGQGEISPQQIIKNLFKEEEIFEIPEVKKETKIKIAEIPIRVGGERNLLIKLAKCCSPIPGEKICAYITKNRGAIVHRNSCNAVRAIREKSPKRLTDALWEDSTKSGFIFPLKVVTQERLGMLRDISSAISNMGFNIVKFTGETPKEGLDSFLIKVEVSNIDEAEKLFLGLRNVKGVIEVKRE